MLKRLQKWLKRPENTYARLANLMGYKSRSTIYNWLYRGRIPRELYPKLKEVFNESVQKSRKEKG